MSETISDTAAQIAQAKEQITVLKQQQRTEWEAELTKAEGSLERYQSGVRDEETRLTMAKADVRRAQLEVSRIKQLLGLRVRVTKGTDGKGAGNDKGDEIPGA